MIEVLLALTTVAGAGAVAYGLAATPTRIEVIAPASFDAKVSRLVQCTKCGKEVQHSNVYLLGQTDGKTLVVCDDPVCMIQYSAKRMVPLAA